MAVAGGQGFTLTVKGKNFSKTDTVEFGGEALPSTYISSSEMQAQVPSLALGDPGSVAVIVATSPPSAMNFGGSFTIADAPIAGFSGMNTANVAIQAHDMVWDPSSSRIYLSVAASDPGHANTIAVVDPVSGQIDSAVNPGGEPDRLAISSDSSFLYAGMDTAGTVERLTLPALAEDISISLGPALNNAVYFATDVEVSPGNSHTIAVLRGLGGNPSASDWGGLALYDDAVARPDTVSSASSPPFYPVDFMQWNAAATQIYAGNNADSAYGFYVLSVSSTGAQESAAYPQLTSGTMHYDASTGYIYTDGGEVLDPSSGQRVGSFPTTAVGGPTFSSVMVPDGKQNIAWFIGQASSLPGTSWTLEAFDMTNYTLLGAATIPDISGWPVKLIRWGSDGLAFLTTSNNGPAPGNGVYLLSGTFVTSPGR